MKPTSKPQSTSNTTTPRGPRVTPLNAYERETVILMSDGDASAVISTHQRRILTKLEKNPAAHKIEDLTQGSQRGGTFTLPAEFVTFRSRKRTNPGAGRNATFGRVKRRSPR